MTLRLMAACAATIWATSVDAANEVCSNYSGMSGIAVVSKGETDSNGQGRLDLKPGTYQLAFSGGRDNDVGQFDVTVQVGDKVLKTFQIDKKAGSTDCGPITSITVPTRTSGPVVIRLKRVVRQ